MVPNDGQSILQEGNILHDARADIRMKAHDLPFRVAKLAGFVKDGIADAYLANIVQKSSSFQRFELMYIQRHFFPKTCG